MDRPLENGNGKALAQLGSAQNQKGAYSDSNSFGSSLLRRIIDTIPALAWLRAQTDRLAQEGAHRPGDMA